MNLFLCFYGDSALWDNIVLVPGYPSGHSYFRPFRYRDKWIQRSLLAEIQNTQKCKELLNIEVNLCMRFLLEKNKWTILPIRKAFIRHIDIMPDNHYIYFSMGPLYDFSNIHTLAEVSAEISESEHNSISNTLFFRSDLGIVIPECENDNNEDTSWVSLADLVAKETNLPIKDEAKKSVFLRSRGLSHKKFAERGTIYHSLSLGEVHGTILTEGLSYELIFYHRVPSLIDHNISLKKLLIKFKTSSSNLELSRLEEDITGNYQKHVLNVTALRTSGTNDEIIIELPEQVESQDGSKINTTNSHIPLKIKTSFWYRLKQTWFWLFVIWASLFANVIVDNLFKEKFNLSLTIVSAIIALLSAVGVFILQQKGTTK